MGGGYQNGILRAREDGNLSKGTKLPSGLASMFVELAGANLAWG